MSCCKVHNAFQGQAPRAKMAKSPMSEVICCLSMHANTSDVKKKSPEHTNFNWINCLATQTLRITVSHNNSSKRQYTQYFKDLSIIVTIHSLKLRLLTCSFTDYHWAMIVTGLSNSLAQTWLYFRETDDKESTRLKVFFSCGLSVPDWSSGSLDFYFLPFLLLLLLSFMAAVYCPYFQTKNEMGVIVFITDYKSPVSKWTQRLLCSMHRAG